MRILVTGGNGQLGRSIYKIVSSNTKESNNQNPNNFIFAGRDKLDLSKEENIANYFDSNDRFDIVINCAAYTAVDKAEEEQDLANQINHLAVKQLAEISKKQKTKLIHISTDYVFDGVSGQPYLETDVPNPINIYGKTKLAGERALQEIMLTDAAIVRTSWLYSEFGSNFVKTILSLIKERDVLDVVKDEIGSPTYATDLAEFLIAMINDKNFSGVKNRQDTKIYHYSNKGECSRYVFAKEILRMSKIKCEIRPIYSNQYVTSAKRPKNTVLSYKNTEKKFGVSFKNWVDSYQKMSISISE